MKKKYVCHGIISSHINFDIKRTMRINFLFVKTRRRGEKEKSQKSFFSHQGSHCKQYNFHNINTIKSALTFCHFSRLPF